MIFSTPVACCRPHSGSGVNVIDLRGSDKRFAPSIHLDARLLDHLSVLRHFGANVRAELLWCGADRIQALRNEFVAYIGCLERLVGLSVEARNRGRRAAAGCDQTEPGGGLKVSEPGPSSYPCARAR